MAICEKRENGHRCVPVSVAPHGRGQLNHYNSAGD